MYLRLVERNPSRDLVIVTYNCFPDIATEHGDLDGRRVRVLDDWYYPHSMKFGRFICYIRGNRAAVVVSKNRPFDSEVLSETLRSAFGEDISPTDISIDSVHNM